MKKFSSIFILGITLAALAIFGITLKNAVIAAPEEKEISVSTSTTDVGYEVQSSYPARLIIPSIGVDAKVQRVGVSVHKTMAVPTNYTDVGWFRYGPIPGNSGSAVMAGHLDNGLSLPGVFKHLSDLKKGDEIIIKTEHADEVKFKVTATSTLDYDTEATQSIFTTSGKPMLHLITCEGTWNKEKKTYSNRLLVTAELER
jgi:LPXTG-site transpeptidase (sortase) family protein